MVVRYVCKHCGYELFRFENVGQDFWGLRTPSELKVIYNGRCPRCGKELETPRVNDIIIRFLG